jgi:tRNA A-37 threonylcarbamoyl transferase component Bud32
MGAEHGSTLTTSLLAHQRNRWDCGERVPVEDFLKHQPGLSQNTEVLLDLIYAEVVLRREAGELPTPEEYVVRFPALAEPIRTQFEVDAAIGGSITQPAMSYDDRAPPTAPAGYEIQEELGRGGMGVVYKARQAKLNRVVALKMIRSGEFADPAERSRFESEAQAIARLSHPNIIQIYEVGEVNGRPFLALEYVPGKSLADLCSESPLAPRPAAALAATLARAVQHAHEAGVLHRDLKPANILLAPVRGTELRPKITDFGLAKQLGTDGPTRTGDFVGTPNFAAPEQAIARAEVGPAADVYALGAMLYHMLTGRPPFAGATPLETIDLVRFSEVVPPSRLRPNLPPDLETITLTCLRKEPNRRYGSAAALAADLDRFLIGKPIVARSVGAVEKALRWCRRRPAVAALAGSIATLALTSLVTVTVLWQRAATARDAEGNARTDERLQREQAEARSAELLIANARDAWLTDDLDGARRTLAECPAEYHNAEWTALDRSCRAGRQIVAPNGTPLEALAVSWDGQRVAGGTSNGHVYVWESGTGKLVGDFPLPNQTTQSLAFGRDGRVFAATFGFVLGAQRRNYGAMNVLDPPTGRATTAWTIPERPYRFTVSPDGRSAVSFADKTRVATVQDAESGEVRARLETTAGYLVRAVFSPDGCHVATASVPQEVICWEVDTGRRLHTVQYPDTLFGFATIALAPAGHTVCVSGGSTARTTNLFFLESANKARPVDAHLPFIYGCAFSPDGRWIAAHDNSDSILRVWDAATGREEITLRGIPSVVNSIAFSADSKFIVAGYRDGRVIVWDLSP